MQNRLIVRNIFRAARAAKGIIESGPAATGRKRERGAKILGMESPMFAQHHHDDAGKHSTFHFSLERKQITFRAERQKF